MYDAEEASLMSFEDGLKALADIREQTGWHGKENSFFNAAIGAEGMFVHEYGHALANDCGLYFGQEHYEKLKAIFDGHTAEEISRDISIYATTNPEEMFAEAFVLSFEPRLRNPLIDEIMGLFNGLWG